MGEISFHSPVRLGNFHADRIFVLLLLLLGINATSARAGTPTTGGISFSGLTGPNLSAFTGITEGDFTAAPTMGDWLQATFYGNGTPSILVGPVNAPVMSAILITDSAGPFKFSGFDYSSNNGDSTYDILGYLGSSLVYNEVGTLNGAYAPFGFSTLSTPDSGVEVDGLIIEIIPGSTTTSVNLDNIDVVTALNQMNSSDTPETGSSFLLLGLGLAGLAGLKNRRLSV